MELSFLSENFCRTCMVSTNDVLSLFDSINIGTKEESLDSILLKCTSIKVTENDIYPLGICHSCVGKLVESFLFFQKCCSTQEKLEHIFKKDVFGQYQINKSFHSKDASDQPIVQDSDLEKLIKKETINPPLDTCSVNVKFECGNITKEKDFQDDSLDCYEKYNDKESDDSNSALDPKYSQLTCKHCNEIFQTQCDLEVHLKSHTSIENLACTLCGKKFTRATDVKRHMSVHTGARPYSCPGCPKFFTQSGTLAIHMKKHEEYKITKPERGKMEDMHYLCSICGKSFKQSSSLTVHLRGHSGEKPYCCTMCDRSFVSSCKLTVHMRFHTGEKPYSCKSCGKCFRQSTVLKKHIKTHSAIKSYQCSCCSKLFSTSYYLNIHMRNHTGERPFKCSVCLKSFADPKNLKQHEKIHSGEKPFLCVICGKTFQRSHHLKYHMKTHLKNIEKK